MTKPGLPALTFLAAALLAVPTALAHGPPATPEYQSRLLADCVDDYFGGDVQTGKNGHDVISLDVQEQYDEALASNVLRFRLTMNGGFGGSGNPTLKENVAFTTPGGSKTYFVQTTDNEAFTGNFDRVDAAKPLIVNGAQDGSRFYIEAVLKWSTLGIQSGQKVTQFKVESFIDSTKGDFMPGTFEGALVTDDCTAEPASGAPYGPADYVVKGPIQYAKLTASSSTVNVSPGGATIVPLTLENLLRKTAQTFTIKTEAPAGVTARFHNPTTNQYSPTATADLSPSASSSMHLEVSAGSDSKGGVVKVIVTTGFGGRAETSITVSVGTSTPATSASRSSTPATLPSEDSPNIGSFIAAAAIAGVAWWRRRNV